jgi:hypothetical protein
MLRLFLKIWVHFQAFKNLYPPKKWENMRKILNFEKKKLKKISFGKKKIRLRYRYRNSTLVSVPDTDTEFRSDTNEMSC